MGNAAQRYSYLYGDLSKAAYSPAVGDGHIKSRLMVASKIVFAVDASMLPPKIGERRSAITRDMDKLSATLQRTSFDATLHRVRYKTVASYAWGLIAIKCDLERHF